MDLSSGKEQGVVIIGKIRTIKGRKFGKLTVIDLAYIKNHKTFWLCNCDCGNTKVIRKDHLLSGETRSCGCLEKENRKKLAFQTTHGQSQTHLYYVWNTMRQRCNNPHVSEYHNYGGRGIKVCSAWNNNFELFYKWATSNGYKQGLTIDRIDNYGNYEPDNCRWVTAKVQANNKRSNKRFEGKTVTQWAEENKLNPKLVNQRIRSGWSLKKALDPTKHINQFK